jgi:transposase-like protein
MAKIEKQIRSIDLRKQGKSYSQIKKILGVSKSTLSRWLKNYPLSKKQMESLRDFNETRIEKFRNTMKIKREKRMKKTLEKEKSKLLPLTSKETYIAGLFLYWGEGVKDPKEAISLANTDPQVMLFYHDWLINHVKVDKKRIRVYLHLYDDMSVKKEIEYWSNALGIPKTQFNKPYIKKSKKTSIIHKGHGHGTCAIAIGDIRKKEQIIMGIKAISKSKLK